MFENPRRGRQARNFTTNAPKILDLKSSSEQIFSRKLPLGAPDSVLRSSMWLSINAMSSANSLLLISLISNFTILPMFRFNTGLEFLIFSDFILSYCSISYVILTRTYSEDSLKFFSSFLFPYWSRKVNKIIKCVS